MSWNVERERSVGLESRPSGGLRVPGGPRGHHGLTSGALRVFISGSCEVRRPQGAPTLLRLVFSEENQTCAITLDGLDLVGVNSQKKRT